MKKIHLQKNAIQIQKHEGSSRIQLETNPSLQLRLRKSPIKTKEYNNLQRYHMDRNLD